jgi:hypothetical protein
MFFDALGPDAGLLQINSDDIDWFASQYYVAHAVWQKRNHARFTAAFLKAVRVLGVIEAWRTWDHKEPCHSANDWQYWLVMSWERYWFGGLLPHSTQTTGGLRVQNMTGTCWRTWNKLCEVMEPTIWAVAAQTYYNFSTNVNGVRSDQFRGQVAVYFSIMVDGLTRLQRVFPEVLGCCSSR